MSIKLTELTVENFMSVGYASTSLANKGLVLISGENNDDDAFESNGSGKSTFFSESVVWGLFGQTIRGTKADDVINRKIGKNTRVSILLSDTHTGSQYLIQRHRKHAQHGNHVLLFHNDENITGKSDTDTNVLIEDIIGMDFLTFTNSVMFGQGLVKMFASSTDADQKKILEQMLQISVFRKAQELAKERVQKILSSITETQSKLSANNDMLRSLENQVSDLQAAEAELGEKVGIRIQELSAELKELEGSLEGLDSKESLEEERAQYLTSLAKKKKQLLSMRKKEESCNDIKSLIQTNSRDLSDTDKGLQKLEKDLEDLQNGNFIAEKCQACGQDLPTDDTSHVENHLWDSIEKLKGEREDLVKEKVELAALLHKAVQQLEGKELIEQDILNLNRSINNIDRDIEDLDKKEKDIHRSIVRTNKLLAEQESLLNTTYSSLISDTLGDIRDVKKVIELDQATIGSLLIMKDKYEFWVEAYGNQGIKSVLLDSVTPLLNERVHYYLSKLTGGSIDATFSTQQKITSGKNKGQVKDKFGIEVVNKNGDANYKGNSGGEKRRVDIGINMALQDLVFSRSSKRLDLIVFDEVFEGLDAIGCENAIRLLEEKAHQYGTVLVVTHNEHLKQLFTKSFTMVKQGGDTTIKEDSV